MGIYYNEVNACCVPCKTVVPVSKCGGFESPARMNQDPYTFGHCSGSHRFAYLKNARIVDRTKTHCGDVKGFKACFQFLGDDYYLYVRKGEISIDSPCSAICIPSLGLPSSRFNPSDIHSIDVSHIDGYRDSCGVCKTEKLIISFLECTYWRNYHYKVIICIDANTRSITTSLYCDGCKVDSTSRCFG